MKYRCLESGCGWMYLDFPPLQRHYSVKHSLDINRDRKEDYLLDTWKNREIKCSICGRAFYKTSLRDLHIESHRHHELKYKCEKNSEWLWLNV